MHPDLIRTLINQRANDTRAAAREARLARSVRKLHRARRDLAELDDTFFVPQIPDYVEAMFGDTRRAA
jgi:hypothetical protein